MRKTMNAAQKFLALSIYGEFLPEHVRGGNDFTEIDNIVRTPSSGSSSDRMFTFLWKELADEATVEDCKDAVTRLAQELTAFSEALNTACDDAISTPSL